MVWELIPGNTVAGLSHEMGTEDSQERHDNEPATAPMLGTVLLENSCSSLETHALDPEVRMLVATQKGHREPAGVLRRPGVLLGVLATWVHNHVKITS